MRSQLAVLALAFTIAPLAPLAPLAPAAAQGRWKEIGKTSTGNTVYVDPSSVKKDTGIITARIRVRFLSPVVLPNGDQWVVSQHIAMFDCAKSRVAGKQTIYYSDVAATKVVQRDSVKTPGFGPAIGGTMSQVALDYFCKKK